MDAYDDCSARHLHPRANAMKTMDPVHLMMIQEEFFCSKACPPLQWNWPWLAPFLRLLDLQSPKVQL